MKWVPFEGDGGEFILENGLAEEGFPLNIQLVVTERADISAASSSLDFAGKRIDNPIISFCLSAEVEMGNH